MCHALVVDRDPTVTGALTKLLRDDGHRVSAFNKPYDAITALERWPFDLVIADLEKRAPEARAIVRVAREKLPNACVVIVAADAGDIARSLFAEGACVVADKPLDYAGLLSFFMTWRNRAPRERPDGIFLPAARR